MATGILGLLLAVLAAASCMWLPGMLLDAGVGRLVYWLAFAATQVVGVAGVLMFFHAVRNER